MKSLKLYIRHSCPYCHKVITFIKKNNLELALCDIGVSEHLAELLKVGGKRQVPCLFIDGMPLYESDDIIQWLKKHRIEHDAE
jgi:glutaredoxin 3